jgi:hypothetical protein
MGRPCRRLRRWSVCFACSGHRSLICGLLWPLRRDIIPACISCGRNDLSSPNASQPVSAICWLTLIESRRVGGQPRQRTVAYLGWVLERRRAGYGHAYLFWKHAKSSLDALSISVRKRREIERALTTVVPKPTPSLRRRAYESVAIAARRSRHVESPKQSARGK